MMIDLVVHRQLNAREILVVGDKWKELYDFFQEGIKKYGLYFYTYKNNPMPFYVGKCTAKSFNILGRVWDELDDCERGASWLGKDINLLQEFEPFNDDDPENNTLNPWKKLTGKNLKNRIKRFINNITVSFTYLDINEEARIIDKILGDLEVIVQQKLVERNLLPASWTGTTDFHDTNSMKDYLFNVTYPIEGDFLKLDESLFR